jgi:hypothetical protein
MSSYTGGPPSENSHPPRGVYHPATTHPSTEPESQPSSYTYPSPSKAPTAGAMDHSQYGTPSHSATYQPSGHYYQSNMSTASPPGVLPPQAAYQSKGHYTAPITPIASPSSTMVNSLTPISSQTTPYRYDTSPVSHATISGAEKGEIQATSYYLNNQAPSTGDPITYFRRHRITAPWLEWLDMFEPDTRRRWWKRPKRVKLGTRATADPNLRQTYAWQHVFGGGSTHTGPGYRMKDGFDRVHHRQKDERYVSSYDGGLKELIVQCTDEIFQQRNDAPWSRARITDLAPFALRVADWCAWNVEHPGVSKERRVLRRVVGNLLLFLPVSRFFLKATRY